MNTIKTLCGLLFYVLITYINFELKRNAKYNGQIINILRRFMLQLIIIVTFINYYYSNIYH